MIYLLYDDDSLIDCREKAEYAKSLGLGDHIIDMILDPEVFSVWLSQNGTWSVYNCRSYTIEGGIHKEEVNIDYNRHFKARAIVHATDKDEALRIGKERVLRSTTIESD